MTPKIRSVGRGPAGRRYLSSERELRLGVCFWFRLFNVAPETTARFSHLDDQRRDHSPPCRAALRRTSIVPRALGPTAGHLAVVPAGVASTSVEVPLSRSA